MDSEIEVEEYVWYWYVSKLQEEFEETFDYFKRHVIIDNLEPKEHSND